jgi:hypothetical protein
MIITQDMIDAAYDEGVTAFYVWYGSHGPTLKIIKRQRPINPFSEDLLQEAWQRGFNKDCRRVIAPKPWPRWRKVD